MPQLPDRPDLAQLRRQARELHRAAADGDVGALRRVRQVSEKTTLSTAQLAMAREYGFPSWPKLKDEAERRRASAEEAGQAGEAAQSSDAGQTAPVPVKSWREMRDWSAELLRSRTGADVAAWNQRVARAGFDDEPALREWLAGQGVTGYAQALLVWERFGYPDFMTADAGDLIEGQYADRPQLRPILDAVLALLPALGPATVQARKTIVSLVTPRRTFAVVRATTKDRVDLGLRLDNAEPGGRLQSAKGIGGGGATVRIALRRPEDIDDEVRDLMRRAYEENTAPPPPPRPARRSGARLGTLTVVIEGSELPGLTCRPEPDGQGHRNVHVALYSRSKDRPSLTMPGNPWTVTEPVPGDAPAARWEMEVSVKQGPDGGFDFAGPFVRGVRDDRHLGLAWGDLPGDGTLRMFRGAKLRLVDVDPGLIEQAMRPRRKLIGRIRLTDARGNPICARVHPPYLTWSVAG